MSIASRITSIEGHISDIYDSVELTGVDTTDIDKNLVNVPNTLKEGYIDIINNGTDTLYNNFPKVSGEGTSLTLNNTYQAPMRNLPKGNTSQTGTPTPTSPIPVNVVSGDNEVDVTGENLRDSVTWQEGKAINSNNEIVNTSGWKCSDYIYIGNGNYIYEYNGSANTPKTLLYDSNKNVIQVIDLKVNLKVDLSIYNPTYIRISSAGGVFDSVKLYQLDTYNIDLPVENLLNLTQVTLIGSGSTQSNVQTNSITLNGKSAWGNTYFFITNTFKNTNYTASCKAFSSIARKSGLSVYGANDTSGSGMTSINGVTEDMSANVSKTYINSFNSGNYEYLAIRLWNNATGTSLGSNVDLNISDIMLEVGTKANTFVPYGTTPIELCKIGNYQDYFYKDSGKWYLHKEIGKVVLNGSEHWETQWNVQDDYGYRTQIDNILINTNTNVNANLLSNNFTSYSQGTLAANQNPGICARTNQSQIIIKKVDMSTPSNFKEWLSNNNTSVYFRLATPTNTEITDTTLINQLEELYIAKSKENQTNISQINNDLGFIISASALKKGV